MTARGPVLTALSIIPSRELASQFSLGIERTRAFQVLSDFKSYPSLQTLEIRLRQTPTSYYWTWSATWMWPAS
jgi:hypothetical protein